VHSQIETGIIYQNIVLCTLTRRKQCKKGDAVFLQGQHGVST
jgi:hypothetical protein